MNTLQGRDIDLELLQPFATNKYLASPQAGTGLIGIAPRVVVGIQKLVQRYINIFLTTLGSVAFDTKLGTNFFTSLAGSGFTNYRIVRDIFALANDTTIHQLSQETSELPDDEIIESAELTDIDFDNGKLQLTILITSAAGESYEYILPVATVEG